MSAFALTAHWGECESYNSVGNVMRSILNLHWQDPASASTGESTKCGYYCTSRQQS